MQNPASVTDRRAVRPIGTFVLLVTLSACQQPRVTNPNEYVHATKTTVIPTGRSSAATLPYDFSAPDARFELPKRLREISGITQLSDSLLGAVQDEDGLVFFIDFRNGQVVDERRFAGKGDYEDIQLAGDSLFVLRSNGMLYGINDWRASSWNATKQKLPLPSGCDAEGLALDRSRGKLLISCKENPGKGRRNRRATFSYDLESAKLDRKASQSIDLDELMRLINPEGSKKFDRKKFKPSSLAQQPGTHNWYYVSSVEKLIVVLDSSGQLIDTSVLSADLFRQPEGLSFLRNGDLFISNEGAGKEATLLRFNIRTETHN